MPNARLNSKHWPHRCRRSYTALGQPKAWASGEVRDGQLAATLLSGLGIDDAIARITRINGTPEVRAYLTDALGSAIALVRQDQSVETGYAYSPYGQTRKAGVEAGQLQDNNAIQYTARENDGAQGGTNGGELYYYRARYYDPVLKRFISEDPIGLAGGPNVYGYVGGNPINRTDPSGLFGVPGAIAGGIVGAVSGGFGAAATGGNVTTGAIVGGIGGAFVGGLGTVIGPSVAGQVLSRITSGVLGNVLGQGQSIGDPGFQGFNMGSILGSGVGGALGGLIAPASYGTAFSGPLAGQIIQRGIAGLPGASVSGTSSLIGNKLGAGQACLR